MTRSNSIAIFAQRYVHALVTVALLCTIGSGASAEDDNSVPDFVRDVRPIFDQHCLKCHGAQKQRGGFRVDASTSMFSPADSGEPPILPGDPDGSELILRIVSDDDGQWMPPEGPRLSESEIETITSWIRSGATWPDTDGIPSDEPTELTVTEEDRTFWSFQTLRKVSVPRLSSSWIRNPIDSFVLHRMRQHGLAPNPSATSLVLLRRMHLDVLGLGPEETVIRKTEDRPDDFLADELIDLLLANEHFGERWARHWLDVVRYADSNGYENDLDRPHAYQYRDFVIRALNQDLPFDEFVRWQIAGDELKPETPLAVAATGFLAAGPLNRSAATAPNEVLKGIRYDELDDIVSTTSQAFLGLTLGCARCHDHKYDAIPTRDYYRIVASFATSQRQESSLQQASRELDLWRKQSQHRYLMHLLSELDCTDDERKWLAAGPGNPAESKAAFRKYGDAIAFDDDQWWTWLSDQQRQHLQTLERSAGFDARDSGWQNEPALFVTDRSNHATEVRLLQRGDVGLPTDRTPPGFLTVLTRDRAVEEYQQQALGMVDTSSTTGNRAAFALWMTDLEQGAGALAARVIVNRIWHHYFGVGLVDTPNDFGVQGGRPSHPDLLEWLAGELIRHQWRLKPIHRLILQSNTYRQSGVAVGDKSVDPENRWLSRRKAKRLDSEATRDAILRASGRLNQAVHGAPIRPFVPTAAMATRSRDRWPEDVEEGPEHWRRSLYIFVKRSIRFPMMEAFDAPDPTASCGRRVPTTVATQALTLLNDPFVRGAARDFATSIESRTGSNIRRQIDSAFRRSLGRSPTASESQQAVHFLETVPGEFPLADLCHALLMCNEFVYIE